jgi:hypothetical protein
MLKKNKKSSKNVLYSGSEPSAPNQESANKELNIKDRLILRAFSLFSERGFAQVSLDDVASEENVTKVCITVTLRPNRNWFLQHVIIF